MRARQVSSQNAEAKITPQRGNRLHVGVFGPGDSGKTTLVKQLSRSMWFKGGFKSLVLDPNGEGTWGNHSLVTTDEEYFMRLFWANRRCFCVIEEATETIKRDQEKNSLFTRGRHRGHKICVVGHSGTNLLPIHRLQLHTLYLFRQPKSAAKIWAELFTNDDILKCTDLNQFEFIRCELFRPVTKHILLI